MSRSELKPGIYEHYKKNRYKVLGIAKHTETKEELALYQPLYGDRSWCVRPLNLFLEDVEVDGKTVPRFKYISEL